MTKVKFAAAVFILALITLTTISSETKASYKDTFAELMNEHYGNVCRVKIEGTFTKTIRVDWTENTSMLHTIKVFSEIGEAKDSLYQDGVRYFKFPNDAGTYNIIDWKTGEKKSNTERAPYYFPGD